MLSNCFDHLDHIYVIVMSHVRHIFTYINKYIKNTFLRQKSISMWKKYFHLVRECLLQHVFTCFIVATIFLVKLRAKTPWFTYYLTIKSYGIHHKIELNDFIDNIYHNIYMVNYVIAWISLEMTSFPLSFH